MNPSIIASFLRALRPASVSIGIFLAMVTLAAAAGRTPPEFVPGLPDVPSMRGLNVEQDATVVFDKPDGRIIAATAVGPVATSDFLSYYRSALPELGWIAEAAMRRIPGEFSFHREDEMLRIQFAPRDDALAVRFFLSPR